MRKLLHADRRTHQLRFLCAGASGRPSGLKWYDADQWGEKYHDGAKRLEMVRPVDPATENIGPESDEGEDDDEVGEEEDDEIESSDSDDGDAYGIS